MPKDIEVGTFSEEADNFIRDIKAKGYDVKVFETEGVVKYRCRVKKGQQGSSVRGNTVEDALHHALNNIEARS